MFRTYDSPKSDSSKPDHIRNPGSAATCLVWEAARATSAAPQYFHPVVIDKEMFVDGGFGTNNPTFEAFAEVTQSKVDLDPLVISIGSGAGRRHSSSRTSKMKPRLVSSIHSAIDIATDTKRVHEEMSVIARRRNFEYFRFTVDEGLEDVLLDSWSVRKKDGKKSFETIDRIAVVTERYLERREVWEEICRCAQLLVKRCQSQHSDLQPDLPLTFFDIPFYRDKDFVGRETFLKQLDEGFATQNRMALAGIGGVGYVKNTHLISLLAVYQLRAYRD